MFRNERSMVLAKGNEGLWKAAKEQTAGHTSNGTAGMQVVPECLTGKPSIT